MSGPAGPKPAPMGPSGEPPRSPGDMGALSVARLQYDRALECEVYKLLPGEFLATGLDLAISTVLGSCVAVCLHDPVVAVGGMNHFLLPGGDRGQGGRYGAHAMELLINELLRRGAQRERLAAKVAGGARVLDGGTVFDVGSRNADFVEAYLAAERIPVLASELRGQRPRKLLFFPHRGLALLRAVGDARDRADWQAEQRYVQRLVNRAPPPGGGVELF